MRCFIARGQASLVNQIPNLPRASSPHNCRLPWPLIYVFLTARRIYPSLQQSRCLILLDVCTRFKIHHGKRDTDLARLRALGHQWQLVFAMCIIDTIPDPLLTRYDTARAQLRHGSPLLSPTHIVTTRLRQLKLVQTWKLNQMYSNEVGSLS